jgi:predicted nuclease of predicted toxin-antitoxin system
MKLLLDQGIPRSTLLHLASAGNVAEHVGDLGLATASDDAILAAARDRQAIIVTMDADFTSTVGFYSRKFAFGCAHTHRWTKRRSTGRDSGTGDIDRSE